MSALGIPALRGLSFLGVALIVSSSIADGQAIDNSDINIGLRTENNLSDALSETSRQSTAINDLTDEIQAKKDAKAKIPKATPGQYTVMAKDFSLSPTPLKGIDDIAAQIATETAQIPNLLKLVTEGKEQDDVSYQTLKRYTFTNNDSYIGKGVLATNQVDVGMDITTPEGQEIIPYFSYAHGADKAAGTKTGTNLAGGTLSFSQKIYPFVHNHPKAYQPFPEGFTDFSTIYPGYDLKAGVDVTFGDTSKYTYKSGAGSGLNQDQWTVTPNVTFDMYINPAFSVSLIPSYAYGLSTTDTGLSGSNGVFQFQDRNSYLVTYGLDHDKIDHSVLLFEFNSLERDVNLEPQPPTTADGYQTWAKFGGGVTVLFDKQFTFTAQYTYEAFNVSYQAQYVTASLNYRF